MFCVQDGIIRGVVDPCLRLVGSRSLLFPSGVNGRRGFGLKILSLLISLSSHANPQQRLILLQTLQRFFLVLSKANCDRYMNAFLMKPLLLCLLFYIE